MIRRLFPSLPNSLPVVDYLIKLVSLLRRGECPVASSEIPNDRSRSLERDDFFRSRKESRNRATAIIVSDVNVPRCKINFINRERKVNQTPRPREPPFPSFLSNVDLAMKPFGPRQLINNIYTHSATHTDERHPGFETLRMPGNFGSYSQQAAC